MFRPLAVAVVFAVGWLVAAPAVADYSAGVRYWGRGDFTGAAREFLPAAQAGDVESQYMMGRLYSLGDGVPKDFVQAWVWFDSAASHGHSLAADARESMAHILTPDQLAQARGVVQPQPALAQAIQPQQPVEGRQVVLVPRQGVVVSAQPARTSNPTRTSKPVRLAAPGATAEGRLLASGDLTEQVRQAQRSLMREGYYDGPADGTLAPATRDAIRRYQRDVGLPQTGLLSTPMVEQLAQDDQIRMKSDQQQAAR